MEGCESLPESQRYRQRREEYCSCEMASGPNREDPPSPPPKSAWRLWGYYRSVGELDVNLQCQLFGWGSADPPGRETIPAPSPGCLSCSVGAPGLISIPPPPAAFWIPCEDLLRAAAGTIGLQRGSGQFSRPSCMSHLSKSGLGAGAARLHSAWAHVAKEREGRPGGRRGGREEMQEGTEVEIGKDADLKG